jgi:hypothetical protein
VSHDGNQPGRCPYVAAFQAGTTGDPLPSSREGASKPAVLDLVQQVTADGGDAMPPEEQVTVFDYDGTLCAEQPMPIQCGFILRRMVAVVEQNSALRTRQPWRAAFELDYGWPDKVITPHYHGDGMVA